MVVGVDAVFCWFCFGSLREGWEGDGVQELGLRVPPAGLRDVGRVVVCRGAVF